MLRIGHSYDVHRLTKGRQLRLGGLSINSDVESVAHSDGDVLLHAISESILGAMALGDLGTYFPDTADETKNMNSSEILKQVNAMMQNAQYKINNLDATVYLEKPKLSSYIKAIRENIASLLGIGITQISIKATTHEKKGPIGLREAIGAECVVLLEHSEYIRKL